jgi:hypothetical protein
MCKSYILIKGKEMRRVVLFLFLLNGVIFAWFQFQQSQQADQAEKKQATFDMGSVATIKLLGEVPKSELLIRNKERIENEARKKAAAENELCYLIGSMDDEATATKMRIRMGFDDTVRVVLQEQPLPVVFKVFIEPQATRQAALSLEKRLRADGFDSYAEPNGVDVNAVALGVFSKSASAEKVAEQALAKGYEVQVAEKERSQALYYVALGEMETADFDQQVIEKVRLDLPEVKIQEKSCKALALLKSFP